VRRKTDAIRWLFAKVASLGDRPCHDAPNQRDPDARLAYLARLEKRLAEGGFSVGTFPPFFSAPAPLDTGMRSERMMLAGKAAMMSMKLEICPELGFLTVRAVGVVFVRRGWADFSGDA
jgi:hypothetical protein